MKLKFSVEDEMFRQELRQFFESEYPQDIRQKVAAGVTIEKQEYQRSDAALAARGWSAPTWPKEYGGPGWSVVQCYIFDEELERAGALYPIPSGLIYLGPVVYTFGTADQKKQWLPGILDGTTQWAQGYSEPNAGSDLASLRTTAVHDGNGYIVNGEKVWTTYAHLADWIFCLVRTDSSGPKQQGISFLCMDLSSPGITVQPIPSIDGKHHLNRVIFDNVRVPLGNRIGEEGKGWKYANFLLAHERISYHLWRKQRNPEKRARKTCTGDIAMEFSFNIEQTQLRDSARRFIERESSLKATRGNPDLGSQRGLAHWQTFADLGWLENEGYLLTGRELYVPDLEGSEFCLVSASLETTASSCEPAIFMVDTSAAGIRRRCFPTIDGNDAGTLDLVNMRVEANALLSRGEGPLALVQQYQTASIILSAAEALGIMEKLLHLTLEHCKLREQFGQSVVAFR